MSAPPRPGLDHLDRIVENAIGLAAGVASAKASAERLSRDGEAALRLIGFGLEGAKAGGYNLSLGLEVTDHAARLLEALIAARLAVSAVNVALARLEAREGAGDASNIVALRGRGAPPESAA